MAEDTKTKEGERRLTTAAEFDRRLDRINEALDRGILKAREDLKRLDRQALEDRKRAEEDRKRDRESWRRLEESMKEMRRKTEEAAEEERRKTEEAQRRTEETIQRVTKALDKAGGNFNRKWGEFMENLVGGDLRGVLARLGIRAGRVLRRKVVPGEDGDEEAEYDLVAEAGDLVVAVEVKTTLREKHVRDFLRALSRFRERFPEYGGKRVLGAVAFLATDAARGSDGHPPDFLEDPAVRPALEAGLFVIRSPGGGPGLAVVENPGGFTPREF